MPVMCGLVWTIPGWPDPVSSVATPVARSVRCPDRWCRDSLFADEHIWALRPGLGCHGSYGLDTDG